MKRYLLTGLLIWLPVAVALWVVVSVVGLLDRTLTLLPESWQPEAVFGFALPGLGVLLTVGVVWLTGLLAANFLGRLVLGWWQSVLERIPFFNTIYSSVKQVSDTLLSTKGQAFRRAVLVQYPHPGAWSIGFVTGDAPEGAAAILPSPAVSVYVPTALSPTSGFVILVAEQETRPSGMSVDEALKYVVSMGVVMPAGDAVEKSN